LSETNVVESQVGRRVHIRGAEPMGCVLNSGSTWDRLRRAQPGTVFAYDDERHVWVECRLVPVEDGKVIDSLREMAQTP